MHSSPPLSVIAGSILALSSSASSGAGRTLDLSGTVTGFHTALDTKRAGPSPGDIGYTTGIVFERFNTGSVALEAVVGGTGSYVGARGQGRDREVTSTELAVHLRLIH